MQLDNSYEQQAKTILDEVSKIEEGSLEFEIEVMGGSAYLLTISSSFELVYDYETTRTNS